MKRVSDVFFQIKRKRFYTGEPEYTNIQRTVNPPRHIFFYIDMSREKMCFSRLTHCGTGMVWQEDLSEKIEGRAERGAHSGICRKYDYSRYDVKNRFIVYFSVENVLPLIRSQEVI